MEIVKAELGSAERAVVGHGAEHDPRSEAGAATPLDCLLDLPSLSDNTADCTYNKS